MKICCHLSFCIVLFITTLLSADPWGKDADLCYRPSTRIGLQVCLIEDGRFEDQASSNELQAIASIQPRFCTRKICKINNSTFCSTPLIGSLAEILIRFHQSVISPADGPRSHFLPSSSQYTLEAMRKYGFWKGFLLSCDRLMRENDEAWVYPTGPDENGKQMKLDPLR